MTSTRSTRSITWATADAGVAGLSATAGLAPELADVAERAVQVGAGLGVHDDDLAAGLDVLVHQLVGVHHHQVRLEGDVDVRPTGLDHVGPEGQVRHEHAVHHVELDPVDAGLLERDALLAEPGEVGRQDRRGDLDVSGAHRVTFCARPVARSGRRSRRGYPFVVATPGAAGPTVGRCPARHRNRGAAGRPARRAGAGDRPCRRRAARGRHGAVRRRWRRAGPSGRRAGRARRGRAAGRAGGGRARRRQADPGQGGRHEVLRASPDRVEPPCPEVLAGCGGCDLQHAGAELQRELKVEVVRDALARIGRLPDVRVDAG